MRARLYQLPKSAMQSGQAGTDLWVLDREPSARLNADPLMGWAGGGDTEAQVRLRFPTREAAMEFAQRNGIAFDLELPPARREPKAKTYAENFRYGRLENWSH